LFTLNVYVICMTNVHIMYKLKELIINTAQNQFINRKLRILEYFDAIRFYDNKSTYKLV